MKPPADGGRVRFVITTYGSAGDVHPFMALAREMAARGHDPVIITSGKFQPEIEREGLRCIPIGSAEDFDKTLADPDLWNSDKAIGVVLRTVTQGIRPTLEAISNEARESPHRVVLVGSSIAFGARLARDTMGLPMASVHLAPSLFWSRYDPPFFEPRTRFLPHLPPLLAGLFLRLVDKAVDVRFAGTLNSEFEALGYRRVRDLFSRWIHSPDLTVGMFPDWFAAPQADWPSPHFLAGFPVYTDATGSGLDPALETFLSSGPPPIAFAPGSANHQCSEFFREALVAVRRMGRRAVFVAPKGETLPANLPAEVMAVRYVPFEKLFPRCAAVAFHGGVGTMAQCLNAGVPTLVMPMAHDQFDNARRLERLGCARVLWASKWRSAAVERELGKLLNVLSHSCAARGIADRMRQGADWNGLIERLANLQRRPESSSSKSAR